MQISALSFPLTPAIRRHVESRLQSALSNFRVSTEHATVTLLDVNGERGGVDKQCRVSLPVKSAGQMVAVFTSRDLYTAVDGATDRMRELLRRRHSRRLAARTHKAASLRKALT